MKELFYTPLDVAAILSTWDLNCREELQIASGIWTYETEFLDPKYRFQRKEFLYAVRYWGHYFYDKPSLDIEFPAVQKDLYAVGSRMDSEQLTSDFSNLDLFFKNVRLKILFYQQQDYIRIKLRTLLARYGYKRRSPILIDHILTCLAFYHLSASLRGGEPCDIRTVPLDKMIVFRVEDCTIQDSEEYK